MAALPPLASAQPATAKFPIQTNLSYTTPHFISLLQKSSSTKDLTQIHAQLIKSNAIHDPLILTKLLSLYASFDLHSALQLFSSLPQRSSIYWNTLIHGCSLGPTPENSINFYIDLIEQDPFGLNSHTFPPVLKACAKILAGFEGTQIHNHAIKGGFVGDIYVQNSLIGMYFGCGRSDDAWKLFDKMYERNVVSWNCVIGGYAELGLWEDVISLFRAMAGEVSVKPNSVTLVRAVTACCRLGDIETGKWVHQCIVENGILLCLNLGNALMNMYAKFGDMEEAQRLFDEMGERDVVSWTTLVSGYAGAGALELACKLFDEMPVRNGVSWNAMIAGYVHNGCFREAILLYEKMLMIHAMARNAGWGTAGYLQTGHSDMCASVSPAGVSSESTELMTLSGSFLASFLTVPSIMLAITNRCLSRLHLFQRLTTYPSLIHVFGPIVDLGSA